MTLDPNQRRKQDAHQVHQTEDESTWRIKSRRAIIDRLTDLGHSVSSLAGKSLAALQKMLRSELMDYAKTGIGVEKKKRVSDKKKYKTMTAATQKTGGVIKRRGGGIAKRGFGIAK